MSCDPRPEPGSQFAALEPLLARVSAPVQYVGGEVNSQLRPWDESKIHWVICYPDAYAIGSSNQGVAVLYEIINELGWASAERSFAVWPDLAGLMRAAGLRQFTVESHRPVAGYDVIGFSLSTELDYTNVLEILDLAGLPLHARDRTGDEPIVVIGGHCAFNPEPIADFVDVVVLGDGEQAAIALSEQMRDWRAAGRPGGREGLLERLAGRGDFYAPRFYRVTYRADHQIERISADRPGLPHSVRRWVLSDLDDWPYPKAPVVPLAQTVHERCSVEIFRGCSRGCRFCQAGMITRPVRERSIRTIEAMVERGLSATGLDEVGLLSLSSADHSEIGPLARGLADHFDGSHVSLSIPSTRVDAFTVGLARQLSRNGRRSGLTIAPEAGSERLRAVINKNVTEHDIMTTAGAAFGQGWRSLKMYFMCGLPTETDDDVLAIGDLAKKVVRAGRQISGLRDIRCTINIGGFVPKAHTPFQWVPQAPAELVNRRISLLRESLHEDRAFRRAITVRYSDGLPGIIEGLLARGDRRVARVVEAVWRAGGRFDAWSEHFDNDRWLDCARHELDAQGVDVDWFTTRPRGPAEVLPWDHLDAGLDRGWLWDEYRAALSATQLGDCRWEGCSGCGVCPYFGVDVDLAQWDGAGAPSGVGGG